MKIKFYLLFATITLLAVLPSVRAQTFVDYSATLGGATADYKWTGFSKPASVNSGISGNAGQWAGVATPNNLGIAANGGSASNQVYVPLNSGVAQYASDTTDFLSGGGGIYSFFSATHYTVSSTSPLSGLKSLVLQVNIAQGSSSIDFTSAPTLTLAITGGGSYSLTAATFSLVESTAATFFPAIGLTANVDTVGFQWDLSAVTGTITGYTVNFQTDVHGIFIGAAATESSALNGSSVLSTVPEPSTCALMALGLGLIGVFRCRKISRGTLSSSR